MKSDNRVALNSLKLLLRKNYFKRFVIDLFQDIFTEIRVGKVIFVCLVVFVSIFGCVL